MRGYAIKVIVQKDGEPFDMLAADLRMKLYDNDALVMDNIGAMDFQYIPDLPYDGTHDLTMSYYHTAHPEQESEQVFVTTNFTLPILSLTFQVELLS